MSSLRRLVRLCSTGGLAGVIAGLCATGVVLAGEVELTAADGDAGDKFGRSACVSGDYALVGAPERYEEGEMWGAAYVFTRDGAGWSQQAKLTAGDGAHGDYFGGAVCISGECAIVGAYGDDDAGDLSGSAYVFVREGDAWSQQAKLTASDGRTWDCFGISVCISGDYAVVGADGGGDKPGSAYVFVREGDAWTQQAKLTDSDSDRQDGFGFSVSLSGGCAVVGAFGRGADMRGGAYVFVQEGIVWREQAKLAASDGAPFDWFGISVSLSGDCALVGAYGHDDGGSGSGAAYVFVREGDAWTQQAKLTASDGSSFDSFGCCVSISGEYAVVGAGDDDDAGDSSGSAYAFVREGTVWREQAKLTPGVGAAEDYFGECVSFSGDNVLVGAPGHDGGTEDSGAAYVFTLGVVDAVETWPETRSPLRYALHPNRPNPFNAVTLIRYELPEARPVSVAVYNAAGQRIAGLVSGSQQAGCHTIPWNAQGLGSGVYMCRLEADGFAQVRRMVLVK